MNLITFYKILRKQALTIRYKLCGNATITFKSFHVVLMRFYFKSRLKIILLIRFSFKFKLRRIFKCRAYSGFAFSIR